MIKQIIFKITFQCIIILFFSASAAIDSKFPVNVILTHDGLCTWMPLGIWISSCSIDITWFPFDEQRCRLKFGIWSYPGAKVNLSMTSDMMNLDNFQLNGEWRLIGNFYLILRKKF